MSEEFNFDLFDDSNDFQFNMSNDTFDSQNKADSSNSLQDELNFILGEDPFQVQYSPNSKPSQYVSPQTNLLDDDDLDGGDSFLYNDFELPPSKGVNVVDHIFNEDAENDFSSSQRISFEDNLFPSYPYPILFNRENQKVSYLNPKTTSFRSLDEVYFKNNVFQVLNPQNIYYQDFLLAYKKLQQLEQQFSSSSSSSSSNQNNNVYIPPPPPPSKEQQQLISGVNALVSKGDFLEQQLNKTQKKEQEELELELEDDDDDEEECSRGIPWEAVNGYLGTYIEGLSFIIEMMNQSGGQFPDVTKQLIGKLQKKVETLGKTFVRKEKEKYFVFDVCHLKKKKRVRHSSSYFDPRTLTFYVTFGKPIALRAYMNSFLAFQFHSQKLALHQIRFWGCFGTNNNNNNNNNNNKNEMELKGLRLMNNKEKGKEMMFIESEMVFQNSCDFQMKILLPSGELCLSPLFHVVGFCDAQYRKKVKEFEQKGFIQKCEPSDILNKKR